jgi:hypothetical protein
MRQEAYALPVLGASWPLVREVLLPAAFGPVLDEEDYFPPMQQDFAFTLAANVSDASNGLVLANAGIACQGGAWLPVLGGECIAQTMKARPGAWTRYSLTGVSRDSNGAALGACSVKVFLTGNDTKQFETVSDASGNWSIDVGANPGPFYLVEYKVGSPDRAGTSLNTNVPIATQ